jgi:putative peptidoglycan lipid II flippase
VAEHSSSQKQMIRSSLLVCTVQALSVLVAYGREMAVAHRFGIQAQADYFYLGFIIVTVFPSFTQLLLWAVYVPIFIRRFMVNPEDAWEFSSAAMTYLVLALMTATALLAVFAGPLTGLMAPGFTPEGVASTVSLIYAMIPVLLLMGISTQLMALLNALKVFGVATFSQALPSAMSLAGILFLGGRWGIISAAWGWTLGSVFQALLLAWYCRRAGYRYRRSLSLSPALKELAKSGLVYLLPAATIVLLMLVDRSFASLLGSGAIATLNYGDRIFRIPMTVLTTSLFTVSLSYLAESAAGGDMNHFRETVAHTMRLAALLLFPAAVFMFVCREPLTSLAYQHGAFTVNDTRIVAATLVFFAPHVIVQGLWYIVERSMIALGRFGILALSSLCMIAVKMVSAALLYRPMGVPGIVLSTAICFFAGLAINYAYLIRLLGWTALREDAVGIAQTALATIAAGAAATATLAVAAKGGYVELGISRSVARLLLAGLSGGAAYLLATISMGIPEAVLFQQWFQKRVRRFRFAGSTN